MPNNWNVAWRAISKIANRSLILPKAPRDRETKRICCYLPRPAHESKQEFRFHTRRNNGKYRIAAMLTAYGIVFRRGRLYMVGQPAFKESSANVSIRSPYLRWIGLKHSFFFDAADFPITAKHLTKVCKNVPRPSTRLVFWCTRILASASYYPLRLGGRQWQSTQRMVPLMQNQYW